MDKPPTNTVALLSGGIAGTAVDVSLFPLDTVKTRLQSQQGFFKAGGFRGIYAGIGPAVLGSAPGAALFFCTYELTKSVGSNYVPAPILHMVGASVGEITACLIRVPVEVVKQRAQAGRQPSSLIFRETLRREGFRGFYRGYLSTVVREIPFSLIQFPLWEFMKSTWSKREGKPIEAWQSSICGAISGGISAGLTTPLDVAKTRIMLAEHGSQTARGNIPDVLKEIWRTEGTKKLFSGIVPRVMWISIGGAIFLGAYEKSKITMMKMYS
ncbi:mitochondrial S-adenosylmethionine carrier protein-like isoform X1 [Amphiura filiformis]|uniref:mitochondrial S-adenosylmethionine carrier protein-like isoform X1 n=1 Tax=Amphiura filiformis TaxID=82378 RepID=UPI003B21F280